MRILVMAYNKKTFSTTFVFSVVFVSFLVYLVASSILTMALLPAVGVGGLYAEADSLSGSVGTVYPEYQGTSNAVGITDFGEPYGVDISTTTPTCGNGGIPMLVIELDGQAKATNFTFRKDLKVPFLDDGWMVITIDDPAISLSGENLKIFASQIAGDYIQIRNVRAIEGGVEDPFTESPDTWGPNSGQFVLRGGQGTDPNVPGLEAVNIQAWIHGATGERITLETPPREFVNASIQYQTTSEVENFYDGSDPKLGFALEDDNLDFDDNSFDDSRVQRGFGNQEGYFPCSDIGGVTGP
jgi:hypothetical protein